MAAFPFLDLPRELRNCLYRLILLSDLCFDERVSLWRPVAVDQNVFRIGYFKRDSVLPLLLVNRQIHAEAIPVLYGENTFVCHISGLVGGPLAFFSTLPPKYLRFLRKLFVRTGCFVQGSVDGYSSPSFRKSYTSHTPNEKLLLHHQDVAISATLMKIALPPHVPMNINCDTVISCSRIYRLGNPSKLWGGDHLHEWKASSWHLWKLIVVDLGSGDLQMEFRRLVSDNQQQDGVQKQVQSALI